MALPDKYTIVNPDEHTFTDRLFRMWMGAYAGDILYVWADDFETAFEHIVEWADENAPGHLMDLSEDDFREAAKDEGIPWKSSWPDWSDPDWEKVAQAAEADLSLIGHTTLKHGQYIPDEAWGGDDVQPNTKEYRQIKHESAVPSLREYLREGGASGGRWLLDAAAAGEDTSDDEKDVAEEFGVDEAVVREEIDSMLAEAYRTSPHGWRRRVGR